MPAPLHACTIVSKNYLPFARVLARSFRRAMPDGRFVVLLVDRVDDAFDPAAEPFELLEVEALPNLPAPRHFLFKYTLLEANTAVKPFFLEHLLDALDLQNIVYFDPDIWILGSLDALARHVASHSVVLTPHLTDPIDDDAYPGEQAILQSGSYNLGFIALRNDQVARRLLRWWQQRLDEKCLVRIADGLFVDQKWMDLAPGLFGDVLVLDDPGYNIAYWNLHGRRVHLDDEPDTAEASADLTEGVGLRATVEARSGEHELVFFHFSGIQPESLHGVSKHQDRFTLDDLDGAATLYRHYADALVAAGYHDCRPWPYAFGRFSNQAAIPDAARSLFHQASRAQRGRWGDPFDAAGDASYYRWMLAPSGKSSLSRLLDHLHAVRPDLQSAFPDPHGADHDAYRSWLLDVGRVVLKLDDALLAALDRPAREPLSLRAKNRLRRIWHSPTGLRLREATKRRLGGERTRALRRLVDRRRPRPASGQPADPELRLEQLGVNVVGYLRAETGMGEAGRSIARAVEVAGLPLGRHALELGVVARQDDRSIGCFDDELRHDINLFVVNADQVATVHDHLGAEVFAGRINIGLWLWELPDFPAALHPAFAPFDEIWTPSSFCVDALAAVSPVAVRRMPLPVDVPTPSTVPGSVLETGAVLEPGDRSMLDQLSLDDDTFVVFYMFNYLSVFERKNPLAAVDAFRDAFGDDPSKRLVLKTSQHDFAPDEHRLLLEAIAGAANIVTLDDYLERAAIDALLDRCDVYLSLHRSEGYGLTVAEAMARGKTVVATPWSGVVDFFDLNNGLPVRYDLVELTEAVGPYPAGSRWAEPDVAHAAELLRRAADDDGLRRRLGERARRTIADELSVEAVATRLRGQVDRLVRQAAVLQPPRRPA
ncbi:MAG: glycosyltransferase [Acidobacteriota bacterium]